MNNFNIFLLLSILSIVHAFKISLSHHKINYRLKTFTTDKELPIFVNIDSNLNKFISIYNELKVETLLGIHFTDITKEIQDFVTKEKIKDGIVSVLTKHTTTALTINEMESRLIDDTRQFLHKIAPSAYPYLHNDLHLRKWTEELAWW